MKYTGNKIMKISLKSEEDGDSFVQQNHLSASNCRSLLTLGSCVHALKAAMAVDGLSWAKLLFHLISHIINSLRGEVWYGRS